MKITATIFLLFLSPYLQAQLLTNRNYGTVEIPENSTFIAIVDTLYIDTLILNNGAKLKFSNSENYIFARNSIIGKDCVIDAAGEDGIDGEHGKLEGLKHGRHGQPGKSLTAVLNFLKLGSLQILANGGNGGDGGDSRVYYHRRAAPGSYGKSGGNGGNGADGGNIAIYYHAVNFVPVFNNKGRHSIYLSVVGGDGGDFGLKDKYATTGAINGGLGGNGKPGTLLIKKIEDWDQIN